MPAYHAIWQEYERHESPVPTNIRFNAENDVEALRKIFLKKIVTDFDKDETLESWCEGQENLTPSDITDEYIVNWFDNIDIGGWPFLVKLVNLENNEVVYDMGNFDEEIDEIWED